MNMMIFIWIIILTQIKLSHSISGEISDDITFFHKTFPVPPSKRAIIEVDVSYPEGSGRKQMHNNPIMGIYTTNNHINIKKKCVHFRWGQLGNTNLHPRIRLDKSDIRPPKCLLESKDTIHCTGNIKLQDFKPRNFSLSFGFYCGERLSISSLKGLKYNITIREQINETNCIFLPRKVRDSCSKFYVYGSLPNLVGGEDILTILRYWELFRTYVAIFKGQCYQHFLELSCHVIVPECDPASRQVIHPCREMCHDFRKACVNVKLSRSTFTENLPHATSGDRIFNTTSLEFDCDYLPSLGGDVPCFYKPITCKSPPAVKNAEILNIAKNYHTYSVLDTVDYSCNEGFHMEGNKRISCTYNGLWSKPPECSFSTTSTTHPLAVVLPVLLIPLALLLAIIAVSFKNKLNVDLKRAGEPLLPRNREFDAFIIYHFDSDHGFVVNDLAPALEEDKDFKLFIHSRDFIPGHDIKDNIEEGINSSNNAIIVMSQGFVDSLWGKEEFTHCYIENMKDPSFNLFVIMMQPADTLANLSNYMKSLFATKTYLKINDPELFSKLATLLENARL